MRCEFRLSYASSFEQSLQFDANSENTFGARCQFYEFADTDMQTFAGKRWCPFHLPLEDDAGNASPKKSWGFMTQAAMTGALAPYIEDRCASAKPVDLSGLVHWDIFDHSTGSPRLLTIRSCRIDRGRSR
jgi:hypothetical protein